MKSYATLFSFLFIASFVFTQDVDQYAHLNLHHINGVKKATVHGSSSLNGNTESFFSYAKINSSNSGVNWIRVRQADPSALYVLEFQVEDVSTNDLSLGIGEVGHPALARIEITSNATLVFDSEIIATLNHDADQVYRIVQCNGRVQFYVDGVFIASRVSTFVSDIESIVACQQASNTEVFLHFLIADECTPAGDQLYYIPKRKIDSDYTFVLGNELAVYYLEKYAISSDALYNNTMVNFAIKKQFGDFAEVMNIDLNNVYGANNHVLDIENLDLNVKYLLEVSGVNKNQVYYLPFIKKSQ